MNILIIGGTIFLGKHTVQSALERNHNVTLFNRGIHNPHLFPELEKIKGDRYNDLNLLKDRKWDVVIDTSGYIPRIVKASAEYLRNYIDTYLFISTISVYADFSCKNINENSELTILKDENDEQITGETYGPLKVLCEKVVQQFYPENHIIIRPGLIVGEDDPTERFSYWIYKVNNEEKIIAPDIKERKIQFIDVKDLAKWIIYLCEKKVNNTYNATGPDYELNFGNFIEECKKVSKKETEIVWISEEFLLKENIQPFHAIPLWVPKELEGFNNINCNRARLGGLKFRPLSETIKDTMSFLEKINLTKLKNSLSKEKEINLMKAWNKLK